MIFKVELSVAENRYSATLSVTLKIGPHSLALRAEPNVKIPPPALAVLSAQKKNKAKG